MSTVMWAFYSTDFMRGNGMSLAHYHLYGMFSTNGAAASSFVPGFIPLPLSSNPQMLNYLAPRAFNYTEGFSGFPGGANSFVTGQLEAARPAPQEPSGAYAVRQFHSNGQYSLQQRPPQQQKASSSTSTVTSERYKTELCRPFEESGVCRYGNKCQFAHGSHELRTLVRHPKYKTEPCRTFHSSGFCPYGTRCHFIHNQSVPSESTFEELCSTSGDDTEHLGFNREPQLRLQTVNSVSASGLLSRPNYPVETPLIHNHQMMSSGPEPHFSIQPPGAQSELPEFDIFTSSLDSLLSLNNFNNFLSFSSSSNSLNSSESHHTQPSRRLPIFSRLSDSDK
uniref:mRNA decay activator protein ZFP36 n=1 Tax=Nyctomys sumichrasti TaxID=56227 RepID=A0A0S1FMM3_NYCSU|nr:zinc finger protein 36 C3H type-like 3 [Nyctomys sumichrasti]